MAAVAPLPPVNEPYEEWFGLALANASGGTIEMVQGGEVWDELATIGVNSTSTFLLVTREDIMPLNIPVPTRGLLCRMKAWAVGRDDGNEWLNLTVQGLVAFERQRADEALAMEAAARYHNAKRQRLTLSLSTPHKPTIDSG